jgi:hypothetical protein
LDGQQWVESHPTPPAAQLARDDGNEHEDPPPPPPGAVLEPPPPPPEPGVETLLPWQLLKAWAWLAHPSNWY